MDNKRSGATACPILRKVPENKGSGLGSQKKKSNRQQGGPEKVVSCKGNCSCSRHDRKKYTPHGGDARVKGKNMWVGGGLHGGARGQKKEGEGRILHYEARKWKSRKTKKKKIQTRAPKVDSCFTRSRKRKGSGK